MTVRTELDAGPKTFTISLWSHALNTAGNCCEKPSCHEMHGVARRAVDGPISRERPPQDRIGSCGFFEIPSGRFA